jgi:hypothetical protein
MVIRLGICFSSTGVLKLIVLLLMFATSLRIG